MPKKYCVLCPSVKSTPTVLDDKTHPEHVIPNKLGGRLESRALICDVCNGEMGSTIDKALVDDFLWIRNGLEIRSGRRQAPPSIRGVVSSIGKINLAPGWKPERARTERIFLGEKGFRVIAHDSEKGMEAIVHYLRSIGINSVDDFRGKFQISGQEVYGRLPNAPVDGSIGGPATSRAIAKIAFEYLAYTHNATVQDSAFDLVRRYIRTPFQGVAHTNAEPAFFDYTTQLPRPEKLFPDFDLGPCHYIALWTVQAGETLSLVADIILFGLFRWTVELSNKWSGQKLSAVYAINPMTGRSATHHLPAVVPLSADWKETRRLDPKVMNRQIWKAKLMCERYQEMKAHGNLLLECAREILGMKDIPGDREISASEEEAINKLYASRKEIFNEDYRREVPIDMQSFMQELEQRLEQKAK